MADTSMLNVKIELAIQYNEIAWYLLQKGAFIEAEQCIRKGLGFDATNVFLPTNLPTSLLLQGKYQEAENAYKVWKNRPFNQQDLPLYKDIFLEDLKTLEKIGVIPNERRIDVEKVRLLLTNE